MRDAQKRYFSTRSINALKESKALEKRIDGEIERVRRQLDGAVEKENTLFETE